MSQRKANSCYLRDSFLSPKIVDPLTLPNYTRARVCQSDRSEKSPIRRGKGHFYGFNQTTEESVLKFTRKRIDQSHRDEVTQKSKKLFAYTITNPILFPNSDIAQPKKTRAFKPSEELIKYNDNRVKIQRKASASPGGSKNSARAVTERSQSPLGMDIAMKMNYDYPDKIAKKPGEIPFTTLKKVIKENFNSTSVY
ncbi:hypothetical protein SteCoe_21195 [Stentor coeruleus]|uniref:Uncharacterized protein n=1 Tax=Stentor coeruleus TaxID=5963 RepID=A0A1R2BQ68_9CILI|nr:hypothetical protein SteCoe_21195 [Stentor coeruleus]